MNLQFLQALENLRKGRQRDFDWTKWKGITPSTSGDPSWSSNPWSGTTPQVIVYDPKTGKAYPNPQAAQSAGVINFSYNIPAGMRIDWSYWDQFSKQPGPEVSADESYVYSQKVPFSPTKYSSNPYPGPAAAGDPAAPESEDEEEPVSEVDPFAGVSPGRLAEAKR